MGLTDVPLPDARSVLEEATVNWLKENWTRETCPGFSEFELSADNVLTLSFSAERNSFDGSLTNGWVYQFSLAEIDPNSALSG